MNDMILKIDGLTKSYKDFTLDGASFEIEPGTVMGLIGQNGAGKTTIIRLIMNMCDRTGGTITVCGLDNIADDWDSDKFADFLKKWELPEKKKVSALSKGMQTKAMLAVALSHNPEMLILDEPTAGLDPVARIEILDLLRDFVSDGKRSVLFSTHITGDLDKIADVITLIIDGQIRESMSIDAVEDRYAVISGANDKLTSENKKYTIGLRELNTGFESLILRENLSKFEGVSVKNPNVENLLTFSIWQNRKESSK